MSLPWRYLQVDDYVQGTIEKIRNDEVKSLQVGKFYLHGSDLEPDQMVTLFQHARTSTEIQEVSLCGVRINQEAAGALRELLLLDDNEIDNDGDGSTFTTGRRKWKAVNYKCCKNGHGIQALSPPSSSSSSPTSLLIQMIRIQECQMNASDFLALSLNMQRNTYLTHLELFEESLIGHETTLPLVEGIGMSQSLSVLKLSYCQFDNSSIRNISQALEGNSSLEELHIPAGELDDEQMENIFNSISNHPMLRHVKAFRNHCATKGATVLANILRHVEDCNDGDQNNNDATTTSVAKIQSLDLSHQHTERADKIRIDSIAASMIHNTTLKSLILSFNKLTDSDVDILAAGLENNRVLEELDLRANRIGDLGAQTLAKKLVAQKNSCLQKLFLFGNPLGEKGTVSLLQAISVNTIMIVLNLGYTSCYYDEIQFNTCLNRAGRRLLTEEPTPALWPLVLEHTRKVSHQSRGICSSADLLFYMIRHGPALLELSNQ